MSKNVLSEYKRWLEHEDLDLRLKKELIDMEGDENAIYEAFYRNLDFGTSGLRGIMGAGTNRMNVKACPSPACAMVVASASSCTCGARPSSISR